MPFPPAKSFPGKVLITAGPTREYWDPVRFLSNASSGQMGIALAQEALRLGGQITLVLGPIPGAMPSSSNRFKIVPVLSARQMDQAVQRHLKGTRVFIAAAAVSDFRPANQIQQKLKGKPAALTLKLVRNLDILAGAAKAGLRRPKVVVGFALETQHLLKHAQGKLKEKNLDWIVANQTSNMASARGAAVLLSKAGHRIVLNDAPKKQLAKQIWNAILRNPL